MMADRIARLALPLIAVAMIAAPASAQRKKGVNLSDGNARPTASSTATETLILGYRLADYARATADVRAMIVAARMVDSVVVQSGTKKGKVEGAGAGKGSGKPKVETAADLFAEARQLAAGDQDVLAAIGTAQAEASRGVIARPFREVQFVPADMKWTIRLSARGGEVLVVGARRDAATAVDLKIYDEGGNLVCEDKSHNVTMYCGIEPIWTGAFRVELINHGANGTGIAVTTNR